MDNIKIIGEGIIGEGEFDGVKIVGEADFLGECITKNLKICGEGKAIENLIVDEGKIVGSLNCLKNLNIRKKLKVVGNIDIIDNLEGEELEVSGEVKVKNDFKIKKSKINGELIVEKDCIGDSFYLGGKAEVNGLLSHDYIEIKLLGDSKIKEIGGEKIIIKKYEKLFINKKGTLNVETIEGDYIYLENTVCKEVRGEEVIIGENCIIDYVEAKGNLKIHKESKVKESVWKKN
ncbi:MAG: hypothetical protein ACRDAU_19085 [Clostridium sp.]